MPPLPRGTCPVCGFTVALRKRGLVREHRAGRSTVICPGSGKPAQETSR